MYTKCVYTVPLTVVGVELYTSSKNCSRYTFPSYIRGTVYTKCVYTVPLTVVGIEFPLKKATLAI